MSSSVPLSFCLLLLASLLVVTPSAADQSFIRTSCARYTLYPDLCYSSLSRYTGQVGDDPVLLARFAMNVTVGCLKPLSRYITSVLEQTTAKAAASSSEVAALKDCDELIRDAIDLVRRSEREVAGQQASRLSISNAQTWLSAGITDEVTCADGFEDSCSGGTGDDDDVKKQMCAKVKKSKELTSNSLALTNSLANHQ